MKARRYKKNKTKRKKIVKLLGILCIIVVVFIGIEVVKENMQNQDKNNVFTNLEDKPQVSSENIVTENETSIEQADKVTQIGGYAVIGKINIPKIELEDVILEKTTDDSLNLGLTKFWGPEMNEIGNFSITRS